MVDDIRSLIPAREVPEIYRQEGREYYRRVSDSYAEWNHFVRYEDLNSARRLFGGRLMEWMDDLAAVSATRHTGGHIITAAVDNLQFRKGAKLGDMIVMLARTTYVSRTSMEVRVDVFVEANETGTRHLINHAYFTEVLIDEEGNPRTIPYGLVPEKETEKMEYEGALKRIRIRRERRSGGY